MADPLDDIYVLDDAQKMFVVITVLRTTRASQSRMEKKVDWVLRSFVALIVSLLLVAVSLKFGATGSPPPAAKKNPSVPATIAARP